MSARTGSHPVGASSPPSASAGSADSPARTSFSASRGATVLLQTLTGLAFLGLWQAAAASQLVNPILLGEPSRIVSQIVGMLAGDKVYGRTIYDHLAASLEVIVPGYLLGSGVGILLGFAFGRSRILRRVFEPIILAIASVPKIAIAPLFVVSLGIGVWSRLAIVFSEVFFMVFFNTLRGVYEVNEEYVNIVRIMGASRWLVLRRTILPAAMPDILLGLRLGVPFAMTGVVLGEFIASNQGIGWLILYASSTLDANMLWAALVFLVALTWLLSWIISTVERRLLRWQPQRREGAMQV